MLKLLLPAMVIAAVLAATVAQADHSPRPAAATPPDIEISVSQVVAAGLTQPVQVTHAGDGSNRLFVVEQPGVIKIISDGVVLPTPFLDISPLVSCCGERGLFSIAFHPNYGSSGYFYINYTNTSGNTVVARYSASSDPNVADPNSALILLTVDQPFSNHNGGQLMFGPLDGYLYIGMGDGGSGGDPLNHGQDTGTLLGALLRLDVDGGAPYAIPADNPYVGQPGRDEIWAIGLRNPWRFSFDRTTGDLYLGDVGQNAWEEISYQPAGSSGGLNFGWRCMEGFHPFNFSGDCAAAALADPIAEYSHSQGRSVTGGFVYRGSAYPALQGRYFYADYINGKIWSLYQTGSGSWSTPALELDADFSISAFGEDEQGELYVVDYGGSIRRLTDAAPSLYFSTKSASLPHADPGEVVTMTLHLRNNAATPDTPLYLVDTLPTGLAYVPGTLTATAGLVDDSAAPLLRWQGSTASPAITLTYRVTATGQILGSLINRAVVTGTAISPLTLAHALFVPRPVLTSTQADFVLPGSQPNQLIDPLAESIGCDFCHTEPVYNRWRGSMMSQSGRDPLFWAALAVANQDAPGAGEFCLRCHAPTGWLAGRSHPADGSALQSTDLADGIACAVCHRMVDPLPSTDSDDEATALDTAIRTALTSTLPANHVSSAMLIIDPEDNRRGPFSFSTDLPHSAFKTAFLGQSSDAVTESRLCGTCHNIDNPLLSWDEDRGEFWPNSMDTAAPSVEKGDLFPIERTYDEWLNSDFAAGGVILPKFAGARPDGLVTSCQDCHMPRSTGLAAEEIYDPAQRDCQTSGCLPEHQLAGGNSWVPQLLKDTRWRLHSASQAADLDQTTAAARSMLQRAATLTVTLVASGSTKLATVRVINDTGHKLPTGYPEGRRMWLHLQAFDENSAVVSESGRYDPDTGELVAAPSPKIYEVKQGLTPALADLLTLPPGESFHFVLNNTVIKDNRIPPRGYTQAAFDQPGLRPVGAVYQDGQYWDDTVYTLPPETERVTVVLYYQTASKAYIDFLRANGGLDGDTVGVLWDDSKSPPEMMAWAAAPVQTMYLPLLFKQ